MKNTSNDVRRNYTFSSNEIIGAQILTQTFVQLKHNNSILETRNPQSVTLLHQTDINAMKISGTKTMFPILNCFHNESYLSKDGAQIHIRTV